MKTAIFEELREALQARFDIVADRLLYEGNPEAHLKKLQTASALVDRLVNELPKDIDPMLKHYLERQSYRKALDWLRTELD